MSTGTGATDAQIEDAARRHCDLFDILPEYEQSNWIEFFTISAQRLVPPDHRIVPVAALPGPEVMAALRDAASVLLATGGLDTVDDERRERIKVGLRWLAAVEGGER